MLNPHLVIKLNSQSNTILNCSNIGEVKYCSVPVSHFTNKRTDYYYIYHTKNDILFLISFKNCFP